MTTETERAVNEALFDEIAKPGTVLRADIEAVYERSLHIKGAVFVTTDMIPACGGRGGYGTSRDYGYRRALCAVNALYKAGIMSGHQNSSHMPVLWWLKERFKG